MVFTIAERDEEAGIGNSVHLFEKPFLVERLDGPEMAPASRMNGRASAALAF